MFRPQRAVGLSDVILIVFFEWIRPAATPVGAGNNMYYQYVKK